MTGLLARHGLSWKVGMIVPEFTAAAHAAAATEYVAGLPTSAARAFCEFLPLELLEFPAFLGPSSLQMVLMWHPRTEEDAGARYFRSVVTEACGSAESAPRTSNEPSPPRAIHGRSFRKTSRP
jgi:DNA-binding transcriptional LysR family regulator